MGNEGVKRVALLALSVVVLGAALIAWRGRSVNVYGKLSSADLAKIRMVHRAECAKRIGPDWYRRFCPALVRALIAGALNPVEGVYVQENGSVIILYRSAFQPAWGTDRKPRWGLADCTLVRDTDGWTNPLPHFP